MKETTIKITDAQLRLLIKEVVRDTLNYRQSMLGDVFLTEMAIPKDMFTNRLFDLLYPVFENIACICIFHEVNPFVVFHWAERATEPLQKWFTQKIKDGSRQKRVSAINKAFSMAFGDHYEDMDPQWYQTLISHYANKTDEHEQIHVKGDGKFYYDQYNNTVVSLLESLKQSLINCDSDAWVEKLRQFTKEML